MTLDFLMALLDFAPCLDIAIPRRFELLPHIVHRLMALGTGGLIFLVSCRPLILRKLVVSSLLEHFATGEADEMLLISACLTVAHAHDLHPPSHSIIEQFSNRFGFY